MSHRHDTCVGQRFGHYTVVESGISNGRGRSCSRVRCVCGEERVIPNYALYSGHDRSCGCRGVGGIKVGDVFGGLTVLKTGLRVDPLNRRGSLCRCECGYEGVFPNSSLLSGERKYCGCRGRPQLSVGDRFGKLVVVRTGLLREDGAMMSECRCDCGNVVTVTDTDLDTGHVWTCGCYAKKHVVEVGERFGRWTVLEVGFGDKKHHKARCRCDCGTVKLVDCLNLKNGVSKSCGCAKRRDSETGARQWEARP